MASSRKPTHFPKHAPQQPPTTTTNNNCNKGLPLLHWTSPLISAPPFIMREFALVALLALFTVMLGMGPQHAATAQLVESSDASDLASDQPAVTPKADFAVTDVER